MKIEAPGFFIVILLLLQTACAGHGTTKQSAAPLTSHAAQEAKVKAQSAHVHTVLMTLTK